MPTEQVKKHLSFGGQEFIQGQVFFPSKILWFQNIRQAKEFLNTLNKWSP